MGSGRNHDSSSPHIVASVAAKPAAALATVKNETFPFVLNRLFSIQKIRATMKCVVIFGLLWMVSVSPEVFAGPLAVLSNDISDSSEEEDASSILDDDITTRGLARLSSAATCLVAGVEYTHGQQIYRADPCEFCLCLDGEMFCWWQDCPPAMEGPCKNQGPFSPCMSIPVAPTVTPQLPTSQASFQRISTAKSTTGIPYSLKKSSSSTLKTTTAVPSLAQEFSSVHNEDPYTTLSFEEENISEMQSSTESGTTTEEVKNCIVMGQAYREGDSLPHSTGNCLECICGQGGKITCSPHQCVPAGDEINDYRQPGPRQENDVFK
ncbi:uncharacterized protein [Euwallacea fornicatus]|uniref:uncharacterized protein n=1 Tax=Euwallacea fornicatus TaxID=995702 RepID=UPI00338DBF5D